MRFLGYILADPATRSRRRPRRRWPRWAPSSRRPPRPACCWPRAASAPLEEAVKVTYHNGEFTVLDGPFTGAKELVGGWALLECRDEAEAIEWTKRFLSVAGEGKSTIRPVYGG